MKRFAIIPSRSSLGRLSAAQDAPPREISITAKRFEFTPNQITLKRGEPVTLHVSALDRDHGFYQKELKIDLDLSPDHESVVTITPETAGRFVAICDNFCGRATAT